MSLKNPVRTLNPEVARKIAAGEVIDRPAAIVRELMDNAIDSGASVITVETAQGGIEKVRVVDNGSGLTKDDLASCARPHATSKISSETDLLKLSTLGFRGEALSSIAAVCRLSIISGGYRMRASITEDHIIEEAAPLQGTIVQAEGLFENFPARRVFLKRPASEGTICKNTFIEKSLAYPEISFRFISDGQIKLDLPAGQTLAERFVSAMEFTENRKLFSEIHGKAEGSSPDWTFKAVIGDPGIYRTNKKDIHIFVNGRKVNEYSLQQAVEYGGQGYFPNGTFPVAAVFINVNPELVDFNIHPAKKEVRFKDISSLHHGISSTVRAHFVEYTNTNIKKQPESVQKEQNLFTPEKLAENAFNSISGTQSSLRSLKSAENSETSNVDKSSKPYVPVYPEKTFISGGKRAEFFSSASVSPFGKKVPEESQSEKNAAKTSEAQSADPKIQEVISFTEKAISNYEKNTASRPVLSPDTYENGKTYAENINEQQEKYTSSAQRELSPDFRYIGCALGTFILAEQNSILYLIDQHAAHERMLFDQILLHQSSSQTLLIPYVIETKDSDEDAYLESIKDQLEKIGFTCSSLGDGKWQFTTIQERWNGSEEDLEHALLDKKVQPKDIIYSIAAMTACKAAVKDGYKLDANAAETIAKGALLLDDPHCPHGRPVYTTISRQDLFNLVRRTR